MNIYRPDDLAVLAALVTFSFVFAFQFLEISIRFQLILLMVGIAALIAAMWISRVARKRWQQQQESFRGDLDKVVDEYDDLTRKVLIDSRKQFSNLRQRLEQAQNIVNSATSKLSGSLTGLNNETTDQREMLRLLLEELRQIADHSDKEKQAEGLRHVAEETNTLITEYAQAIKNLQENGDVISSQFSDVHEQIIAIGRLLDDVKQITAQTDLLALNAAIEAARAGDAGRGFTVVADEVRNLAHRTNVFSEQITGLLGEINSAIERAGTSVAQVVSTDVDKVHQSQGNLDRMWSEMSALNERANSQSQRIAEISEKARQLVTEGVMSLQFEDIVRQLIDQIHLHTEEMERFSAEFVDVHRACADEHGLPRFQLRNQSLNNLLANSHDRFSAMEEQNVQQTSVDKEGEVELF